MRRRKKVENWGWAAALDERDAYYERLATGKSRGGGSGDGGDAAKTVAVLKGELKALGQPTSGKKAELLVRLAAAKLAGGALVAPQTAAEAAAAKAAEIGVGELHAKVVAASEKDKE